MNTRAIPGPLPDQPLRKIGARDGRHDEVRQEQIDVSHETCTGDPIRPGDGCSVAVPFAPEGVGSRTAQVEIRSDAPTITNKVTLTGVGR
jgi:hypothetical protein